MCRKNPEAGPGQRLFRARLFFPFHRWGHVSLHGPTMAAGDFRTVANKNPLKGLSLFTSLFIRQTCSAVHWSGLDHQSLCKKGLKNARLALSFYVVGTTSQEGRAGVGGVGQRRRMTVEHATQVFAMDRLPGHGQEFKQTGALCLRFQAPVFLRGDLVGQAAEETSSSRLWSPSN